jgi:hypothetical protein
VSRATEEVKKILDKLPTVPPDPLRPTKKKR